MNNFSFSKKFIIRKKNDFIKILNNNISIKLNLIKIIYRKNIFNYPRIGFILKKKKIKKSYIRNKFKRIIKEFFRIKKGIIKNIDIIFFSNKIINILNRDLIFIELNYIIKFLIKN